MNEKLDLSYMKSKSKISNENLTIFESYFIPIANIWHKLTEQQKADLRKHSPILNKFLQLVNKFGFKE